MKPDLPGPTERPLEPERLSHASAPLWVCNGRGLSAPKTQHNVSLGCYLMDLQLLLQSEPPDLTGNWRDM